MPFGNLNMWEILLVLAIVLLLFGAKRLPEVGASLGKGIREFKGSLREIGDDVQKELPEGRTTDSERARSPESEPARTSADETSRNG